MATITTKPFKNNTGSLYANEAGITADVKDKATGALVVRKTGQTTDANGIMIVDDAAIPSSTLLELVARLSNDAPGIADITSSAVAALMRYFTPIASIGSQHFTIPPVTFASDFEVQADFVISDSSAYQTIIGRKDTNTSELVIRTDITTGFLTAFMKSSTSSTLFAKTHATDVTDGKLHTAKVEVVGSTAILSLDGVAVESGPIAMETLYVDRIGHKGTTEYLNGIIANVKLTDNGTLIHKYPIDETFANDLVLKDALTVLGSDEMVAYSNGSGDAYTSITTDDVTVSDQPTAYSGNYSITVPLIGQNYLFNANLSGDSPRIVVHLYNGGSYVAALVNSVSSVSQVLDLTGGDRIKIILDRTTTSAGSATLSSVTIEAGFGMAVNITSADAQNNTFDDSASPHTWTGDDTTVIEVAGT